MHAAGGPRSIAALLRLRSTLLPFALVSLLGCAAPAVTRVHRPDPDVAFVEANGLRFAYLASGSPADPLVLLLHGFPDTARAWDGVREELAKSGYYVVAPYLRGYAPSASPGHAGFDVETLGRDVLALIAAFGKADADLVGHDWGAMSVYSAAALDPTRVRRIVAVVIPHPATLKLRVRDLRRVRHFLALRKRRAPARFARDDFSGVDELYARWSPTWKFGPAELDPVKNSFAAPGSLDAALGYYRDLQFKAPRFLRAPTRAPALVIVGLHDGTTPLDAFDDRSAFAGGVRVEKLPTGHFPHRERLDLVLPLLLEFLKPAPPDAT